MPWIGAGQPVRPAENPAASSSLEHAATIASPGIAPAGAVIEHLTASECRLRTLEPFGYGEIIEFDFSAPGYDVVRVRGHVVERVTSGPRFCYRIRLERMTAKETDDLARAVAETYRQQTRSRARARAVDRLPVTSDGLTRTQVRVPAEFSMEYRTPRDAFKRGFAADVSAGGLSMRCTDALVPGENLELRFTLPSECLEVYPEQTAILDLRTRSIKLARADLRRPFEEMVLRARVVSHAQIDGALYSYGMAFRHVPEGAAAELARYVEAVRLAQRQEPG
jgi:hypothetical protein